MRLDIHNLNNDMKPVSFIPVPELTRLESA